MFKKTLFLILYNIKMKIAVFDVDDTLIIHGKGSQDYYKTKTNDSFKKLLQSKNFDKIYLYTNGTHGHGESIAKHLNIYDMISFTYGRNNLLPYINRGVLKHDPDTNMPIHMKPSKESFNFVNDSIFTDNSIYNDIYNTHEIYFFDDLEDNLKTAKSIGWKTVLIKPNDVSENYIDYVFPNIYSALINMDI